MIRSKEKGTIREIMLYCVKCKKYTKHIRVAFALFCECKNQVQYFQSDKEKIEKVVR
jgi:hypothetical protein